MAKCPRIYISTTKPQYLAESEGKQIDLTVEFGKAKKVGKANPSINAFKQDFKITRFRFFFRIILFNYLVCNSDAHAKNFSLRNSVENPDVYDLTPAYDLLNTSLHIPFEQSRIALDLFKDEDDFKTPFYEANVFYGSPNFMEFAKRIGVVEKRAARFIKQAINAMPAMEEMLDKSFLSEQGKAKYKESIRDRAKALGL